jgi:hypothetical protein
MREKYVEERFPRYFPFGSSKDGLVDIASTKADTGATLTQDQADFLIKDRDVAVDMICTLAKALDNAAPEVFHEIWYT